MIKHWTPIAVALLLSMLSSGVHAFYIPVPINISIQSNSTVVGQNNTIFAAINETFTNSSNNLSDYIVICGSYNTGGAQTSVCAGRADYLLTRSLIHRNVTYNTDKLKAGSYAFEACDYTFYLKTNSTDCTLPEDVVISSQSNSSSTQPAQVQECKLTGVVYGPGEINFYNASSSSNYVTSNSTYLFPCGSTVNIEALSNSTAFTQWTCSGPSCYSGAETNVTIVLNGNITEDAYFKNLSSIGAQSGSGGGSPGSGTGTALIILAIGAVIVLVAIILLKVKGF